jgi:hypothetical protein
MSRSDSPPGSLSSTSGALGGTSVRLSLPPAMSAEAINSTPTSFRMAHLDATTVLAGKCCVLG